jgi:toxin ParE1/3/4
VTPARLRPLAQHDLIERARYYEEQAGRAVAERFVDAAIRTLRAIEQMAAAGSPRIGELCSIPGLRARAVAAFGCGWYYLVQPDHVDVVRLLADSQDLPSILDDVSD